MKVVIDDRSGFCFGVVNAIRKAEDSLSVFDQVYCLGDIVHNRTEVSRLEALGLRTITHRNLPEAGGNTVLIRAHGEPPATYRLAEERGIRLIDATCPVVSALQKKVKHGYAWMREIDGQVVIFGKRGHAEVVGLAGQADGDVLVIEKPEELDAVDFTRPVFLLSQTTQSLPMFEKIIGEILSRSSHPENVTVNDTICRQVSNRDPHLREFSARFDLVLFVSGKKSSNGKALFQACKETNPNSFRIEDEREILPEWLEGVDSVGICGATSTPKWVMEKVARFIEGFPEK